MLSIHGLGWNKPGTPLVLQRIDVRRFQAHEREVRLTERAAMMNDKKRKTKKLLELKFWI
jgi:hypothetical protein